MKIKPFAETKDKYTQFNNSILDYIMPTLKPGAWKVLCFIIRKTVGWHKESDGLPFSQIRKGTGIGSDPTVVKALNELEAAGYIVINKSDDQWESNTYRLNSTIEIIVEDEETPTIETIVTTETIVDTTIETIVAPTIETIESKESKESKKNISSSEKIDPVADILNRQGNVSESTGPNPDDQWLVSRDQAIKIYQEIVGNFGNKEQQKIRRDAILGGVAQRNSFNPDQWRRSVADSVAHNVQAGNIARFWEVYDLGGDYQTYLDKNYPKNGNGSTGRTIDGEEVAGVYKSW